MRSQSKRCNKKWRRFPEWGTGATLVAAAYFRLVEVKQLEQVADGRAVHGDVRILAFRDRIGEVVAAAEGDRFQFPVPLDEFEDGNVIRVVVRDVSAGGVLGHNDARDARAVAEEVQRLHVTG